MNVNVRNHLIATARKRINQTITYQKLSDECNLNLDMSDISNRNQMAHILDEISTYEHIHGRPLLSAIVIRLDDNREGNGFYKMAERLGFGDWKKLKKEMVFEYEQIKECINKWSDDDFYIKNR